MKKLIWAIFFSVAILNCASAHADSITGVITGDDNVSYWNGSNWVAEGNNWQAPETINLNVNQTSENVYFAVVNNDWYPGGDPAGFLASFTDNSGAFTQTGTGTLASTPLTVKVLNSLQWTTGTGPFVNLSDINPTAIPSTLTGWTTPTSYGANGSGNIWDSVNGGPLGIINPNAQWLWTANNDETYTSSGQDNYAYFEINLGVTDGNVGGNQNPVVPEPPTILLFAFAAALLLAFPIRRRLLI